MWCSLTDPVWSRLSIVVRLFKYKKKDLYGIWKALFGQQQFDSSHRTTREKDRQKDLLLYIETIKILCMQNNEQTRWQTKETLGVPSPVAVPIGSEPTNSNSPMRLSKFKNYLFYIISIFNNYIIWSWNITRAINFYFLHQSSIWLIFHIRKLNQLSCIQNLNTRKYQNNLSN